MYDNLQPVPVYGDEVDGSKPLVGVKLKALCGKEEELAFWITQAAEEPDAEA
jgi:hypothetical protein